ncbi:MAG TPA: serine hydrolase domain-containing protein, partial [Pseudomonas sp.]|nr:serine hydrolase domain-containing protein [Pseudomonas sp.]
MRSALIVNGALQHAEQAEPLLPWWSFTKTVLAAAALSLVRDGLVGLDDQMAEGPFSLRQLLRHEAGLADYGELAEYHAAVSSQQKPWSADEMLQRLDATRLRYQAGAGWRYSNVGYLYVARLIERLSGLALEQALTERVLVPLGITRVHQARTPADWAALQLGSSYDPAWVYHGLLVGPLTQTALLLDRLLGSDFLPPALLQAMQDRRVLGGPIAGRPWTSPGYGLGLMQGEVSGGLFLSGHTGGGPGSVVAVYRSAQGRDSATCAVYQAGGSEG